MQLRDNLKDKDSRKSLKLLLRVRSSPQEKSQREAEITETEIIVEKSQRISLKMNSRKVLILFVIASTWLFSGCDTNNITDVNHTMRARNWSYADKVKATVDIKDSNKAYHIYFKLRHTSDYRYSNIFVLFNLKTAQKKRNRRYEFKLAQADGQWNGAGSGNLYTYEFPLLTNFKFPAPGIYELELEQNMRDNPLTEISDAGIKVSMAN